jgi:hypothetical protein
MIASMIIQSFRSRAVELPGVEREVLEGQISETRVFRSRHVLATASLALACALTALVALAGLIDLV